MNPGMNNRVEFVIAVKQVFETYVYALLLSSSRNTPFVPTDTRRPACEKALKTVKRDNAGVASGCAGQPLGRSRVDIDPA